ncbi:ankyrin repeat domain-containing protein 46-like [Gigantopelta aegis]|uniref:ankyrin repeat domain-containing protein 46-like n=1 Tax=Gigantopelta aegis TaxID=1735272 RepID=UPI001B889A4A|nr:ankyrin repeat domain-containing protein 46-like [Gigantopelta aegis]
MEEFDFSFCLDTMENGHELRDAILENDFARAEAVLRKGTCNVNECDDAGRSLLHLAACRGNPHIIRLLLEEGADANNLDNHGNTPLHWCGHDDSIKVLVEFGAHVKACNVMGHTPRQLAYRRGVGKDVIKLFKTLENCEKSGSKARHLMTNCVATLPSIWHEFYCDLGGRNILLLVVGLLAFSLYITYIITGFRWQAEDQIPLDSQSYKIRL